MLGGRYFHSTGTAKVKAQSPRVWEDAAPLSYLRDERKIAKRTIVREDGIEIWPFKFGRDDGALPAGKKWTVERELFTILLRMALKSTNIPWKRMSVNSYHCQFVHTCQLVQHANSHQINRKSCLSLCSYRYLSWSWQSAFGSVGIWDELTGSLVNH